MSRAAYCFFTKGAVSGIGVPTRAEAVARAFTARHTGDEGAVEFRVFGTGDRETIPDWLPIVKNEARLFDTNDALVQALVEYQPDLLLVDSYPGNIAKYLTSKDRPPNVWGVMRNTPGALGNAQYQLPYGIFDRLYQIEPGNHGLTFWDGGATRERTRSIAEHEDGVKDINYQRTPPQSVAEFYKWPEHYRIHRRDSRKLIAPIISVDESRMLSRKKAREALIAHAELPESEATSKKPLVLIAFSASKQEYMKAQAWIKQILSDWGIYDLPENERLLVQAGAFHEPLPELWRYLPGVDYFLGTCGYNTFYETRYLSALGEFTGQAAFWPVSSQNDQPWRADRQTGLFTGEMFKQGLAPLEKGQDYLVDAIAIKLKDYVRPQPAPKTLREVIIMSLTEQAEAVLDKVYRVVQEVWGTEGDELKEVPPRTKALGFPDRQAWYRALLTEFCQVAEAPQDNQLGFNRFLALGDEEDEAGKEAKVARAKEGLAMLDQLEGR
jgi:hypothetical protein